ncbi:MAG: hypothetical protein HeimC3_53220 [Candidatus Heimdallarchaeota archaeon LC_3]|nr:MAG: hypothetical protein HeimC3_53220 [Candidatus Heimdallarchaeota archaeon LC_3]
MEEILDFTKIESFKFKKKGHVINSLNRLSYLIVVILFTLKLSSNQKKASLLKIQLISQAMRNEKNIAVLNKIFTGNSDIYNYNTFEFSQEIQKAIDFSIADELIQILNKNTCLLSIKGDNLCDYIISRDLFQELRSKITEMKSLNLSESNIKKKLKEIA